MLRRVVPKGCFYNAKQNLQMHISIVMHDPMLIQITDIRLNCDVKIRELKMVTTKRGMKSRTDGSSGS